MIIIMRKTKKESLLFYLNSWLPLIRFGWRYSKAMWMDALIRKFNNKNPLIYFVYGNEKLTNRNYSSKLNKTLYQSVIIKLLSSNSYFEVHKQKTSTY